MLPPASSCGACCRVSARIARSDALRDFVVESNRGRMVWFLPDLASLEAKLAG